MEAFRNRQQAARLRRRVAILGDIGTVHDPRQSRESRILDAVLIEQHLERAEPVTMCVLRARSIVGMCVLPRCDGEHLVGSDVEELSLWIDEVLDQPRTGDPIGLRSLPGYPLHACTSSVEIDVDQQRSKAAYGGCQREPTSARSTHRAEAERERRQCRRKHARPCVLVADREHESGRIGEEASTCVPQNEIPEKRRKPGRASGGCQHRKAPLAKDQSHRKYGQKDGESDTVGDRTPRWHQDGSLPSRSARFLNSYNPSKSGAVSTSKSWSSP